jgi:hypothetical protein
MIVEEELERLRATAELGQQLVLAVELIVALEAQLKRRGYTPTH